MKIYFLSSKTCALTVGGAYFGITDKFERFASVCLADNLPVSFTPENALPISFFLNENIRFQAPVGVDVYLLKDAIALYAHDFPPRDFLLRPCAQARNGDLLVSVFEQGSVQVSFQSTGFFSVSPLPAEFKECEISFQQDFVFVKSQTKLAVFSFTGKQVFLENVHEFSVENNELTVVIPLNESLGATLHGTWKMENGEFTRTALAFSCEERISQDDNLLGYAFFESVRVGANIEDMLSADLLPEKDKIVAFLGDFCAVMPTSDKNTCALIYQKAERLFQACYYSLQIQSGKIVDVVK